MVVTEDGTITQVHLTEYQSQVLAWRRRERQVQYLLIAWALSAVIWITVFW